MLALGAPEKPVTGLGSGSYLDVHAVGSFPIAFHVGLTSCSGNTTEDGVKLDFH